MKNRISAISLRVIDALRVLTKRSYCLATTDGVNTYSTIRVGKDNLKLDVAKLHKGLSEIQILKVYEKESLTKANS